MKKIFSLVAIVIAISASAFTAVKDQPQYYFIGTSSIHLFNPEFYVTDPEVTPSCDVSGSLPCLVQVPEGFSDKQDWLEAAEQNSTVLEEGIMSRKD